ncbi:hypothetical protein RM543_12125 [Roseicyclus sp. F158]|uniref:Uncharacterized protein n=1 Tax=Tropicimonas omnivorans TaxID=3075590 RepID=A0ABU3DIC6_9RHOB|nr:hypothetical protein [Roseicyclus sp. F158]MDT0683436.1 hypothetical protein [Roseicyclus sp. F158]
MTMLTTSIPAGALDPNVSDGWTVDRTRHTARKAQNAFLARHGGLGPRTLYRLVSALS